MHNVQSDPRLVRRLQSIARIMAITTIAIGGLVIVGWLLNMASLKSVLPGLATMKFNTALAFTFVGIGLFNLDRHRRIAQAAAGIVIFVSVLTMLEYLAGWKLGIDQLLMADPADLLLPGRMSFVSACNFALVGTALWLLVATKYDREAQLLALVALLLSFIVLIGYVYGVEQLYGLFLFSSVALHTAIAFVLICTGIVFSNPEIGPLRILSFAGMGGYLVRRVLPIFVLIPFIGWLRSQAELAGLFGTQFGLVLFTLSNILILAAVTIWLGYSIHAIDVERLTILDALRQTHAELEFKIEARTADLLKTNRALETEVLQRKQTEEQFRTLLESAPDATVVVNQEGHIVLTNNQAEKIFGYSNNELIGMSVEILMPTALHNRHVGHRADYVATPHVRDMGVGLDLYALRKDGHQFPVEIKLSPIHIDGETLVFSSIRDVAERKQVEQALRETEEQLQAIFDLLPVGASLVNSDRQIVRMNRTLERILAMNMPDLSKGKYRARKYIHGDGTPMQSHEFPSERAFQEQRAILDVEIGVLDEEDGTIWTSVSAAPLPRNQGVVVVTNDIRERRRAEQTLRDSEAQFRATFDYAAIGMALVSLEGEWLRINQAVCKIVGYSQDELLRMTFQEITHPDDLSLDLAYVQQLLEDKIQSYHMEKRYFHKAGHIVWVLLSVSLVRNSLSEPMYFVAQIQNVTARKQAEAALTTRLAEEKEFQNRLKLLHEITVELTLINVLDDFYKRAIELGLERLGYERLGLLLYDKTQDKVVGTYGTDVHGQLVPEHQLYFEPTWFTTILSRAFKEEERFVLDENVPLFSNLEPIGLGWRAVAVLWNGTENTGWLAADNGVEQKPVNKSMLDILSLYSLTLGTLLVQKQTRAALMQSESRFRRAITDAPFPIMIHAEDGEVLNLSRVWSDISGYSHEEISTLAEWTNRAHEQRQDNIQEMIDKIYGLDVPFKAGEFAIRTKSGQQRIWDFIASPLGKLADGRRMVSSMAMDITERKHAELALQRINDQLQKANQEVQQFAYIVSHDLRAPLINLRGFSVILRSSVEQLETLSPDILPALDPAQTQLWQVTTRDKIPTAVRFINTAVDRMDQFTAAILKLSRLGHRQLTFETIDVNGLVQKIINSLLPESDPREIEIVVEELPDVEADRVALDQILGNIISNAIKYLDLRRKGEIVIFGEQDELLTTFHMRDNGRGIAEAQYDKIFAPFRRGISDVEGEGMGLAYVQALVKRHRGDIWFESTPDVGSTFSFTILNRKASPDGTL